MFSAPRNLPSRRPHFNTHLLVSLCIHRRLLQPHLSLSRSLLGPVRENRNQELPEKVDIKSRKIIRRRTNSQDANHETLTLAKVKSEGVGEGVS